MAKVASFQELWDKNDELKKKNKRLKASAKYEATCRQLNENWYIEEIQRLQEDYLRVQLALEHAETKIDELEKSEKELIVDINALKETLEIRNTRIGELEPPVEVKLCSNCRYMSDVACTNCGDNFNNWTPR